MFFENRKGGMVPVNAFRDKSKITVSLSYTTVSFVFELLTRMSCDPSKLKDDGTVPVKALLLKLNK